MINSLIILAGGLGERAKQKIPKQFYLLNNEKKIRLMYLQYPYYKNNKIKSQFDEIIIVVPNSWEKIITKELAEISSISKVISGGKTRTESSYLGLKACSPKCANVLIHDAARPFASQKIYDNCIKYLSKYDSVIPLISTKDTSLYIETY